MNTQLRSGTIIKTYRKKYGSTYTYMLVKDASYKGRPYRLLNVDCYNLMSNFREHDPRKAVDFIEGFLNMEITSIITPQK